MNGLFNGKIAMLFSVLLLLFIAGCGDQSSGGTKAVNKDGDTIKIGVVIAETGPASTLGSSQVNTVELLQKQLDEAGPIDGKTIQLVKHDYETDDTKAVVAMDKLISDGVVAVIGATQSSTTMALMPKAIEKKIPLFTIAPIKSDSEYVYSMTHSSAVIAELIVENLNKNNIKKVAWLNAADGFGVTGLPAFEELAKENDIEIVAHEEFDATATDMTIQLTKVRNKNPETIIVWSRTPGAGIVARNYQALGFDIPMIQSTAASNLGFLEQVKDNHDNITVVGSKLNVTDQLPDSELKEVLKSFTDSYALEFNSDPDLFAAAVIDGINVVVEAVKAGNTTSAEIHHYLQNDLGPYLGVSGTFDFGVSQASPNAEGLSILGIENNAWKYIE